MTQKTIYLPTENKVGTEGFWVTPSSPQNDSEDRSEERALPSLTLWAKYAPTGAKQQPGDTAPALLFCPQNGESQGRAERKSSSSRLLRTLGKLGEQGLGNSKRCPNSVSERRDQAGYEVLSTAPPGRNAHAYIDLESRQSLQANAQRPLSDDPAARTNRP